MSNQIEAVYSYTDEQGRLLYQVVRRPGKQFVQRRPCPGGRGCGDRACKSSGDGTSWHWSLDGTKRVLYRLGEVKEAVREGRTVYVVEGEKDADTLAALGLPATTNPGGAGKWKDEYSEALEGAKVVILPDNDDAGRRHAEQVASSLFGVAQSIKVVELGGLPEKGDVSDWLEDKDVALLKAEGEKAEE